MRQRTARTSLPLDALLDDGPQLLAAGRLAVTELMQALGTPEVRHIDSDGVLCLSHWAEEDRRLVEGWAADNNAPTSLEVVPDT